MTRGVQPDRSTNLSRLDPHTAPPQIASVDLFAGRREVCIEHAGEIYRLRITGRGKLILTK